MPLALAVAVVPAPRHDLAGPQPEFVAALSRLPNHELGQLLRPGLTVLELRYGFPCD